jgi:hypothetical protein
MCAKQKRGAFRFRLRRRSVSPPFVLPSDVLRNDGTAFAPTGHRSSRFLRRPAEADSRSTSICYGELYQGICPRQDVATRPTESRRGVDYLK